MSIRIGNLEAVNPQEVWRDGHAGFVSWLAEPDTLVSLSDFLGLKLERIDGAQLKHPIVADVLCRVAGEKGEEEHIVAIQTRLGDSPPNPHDDLERLIPDIDGIRHLTFVWVASPFTDKHRQALDNLNLMTKEGINFFGVELGMWRIGKSDPAVWLDVVSKPAGFAVATSTAGHTNPRDAGNQQAAEATPAAVPPSPAPVAETPVVATEAPVAAAPVQAPAPAAAPVQPQSQPQAPAQQAANTNTGVPHHIPSDFIASIGQAAADPQQEEQQIPMTQEYWQLLRDRITQKGSALSVPNATPEEWTSYDIGCHNFYLIAVLNFSQPSSISVALVCQGPEARRNFGLLQKQKEKIEWEVGVNLQWLDSPGRPFPHVVLVKTADPNNKDTWQHQHDWLITMLEKFDAAFRPRAKMIDSSSAQSG
ncbi:MAG: DUF4268 domain-containing protein [Alphaproteobacteria bacterium GM202ARS2]|nr:DUF4268 domain-containing protein [Alphaproteobacteria bacterium GM202ARS2]